MNHPSVLHTLPDGTVFDPLAVRPTLEQTKKLMEEEAADRHAAAIASRAALDAAPAPDALSEAVETLDLDTGLPIPAGTPTIERWEEVNIDAFNHFMRESKRLTEGTEKTYRSAFRRVIRSFSLSALRDPTALQAYRSNLPLGSRNTFDAAWPIIARFMVNYGISVPLELPAKPRIRFAHPLASDLMTIGGVLNYSVVPEMTWSRLFRSASAHDVPLLQACRRICEFQTGLDYGLPPKPEYLDTPIVPASAKLDPMPEWRIRWIIDSESDVTAGPVEQHSALFFQKLVALGINGFRLREFARLYCLTRNNIKRHFHAEKTMTDLFSYIHPLKLSDLRARLVTHGDENATGLLPLW